MHKEGLKAMENECPVCGAPCIASARNMRCDSYCGNKHSWHYCIVHGTVVIGESIDLLPMDVCTCGKDLPNENDLGLAAKLTLAIKPKLTTDMIKSYIDDKSEHAWSKMGSPGSSDYVFNEENYFCGYYRALEDLLKYMERYD